MFPANLGPDPKQDHGLRQLGAGLGRGVSRARGGGTSRSISSARLDMAWGEGDEVLGFALSRRDVLVG